MFHIELRQFPSNFCRFNLSESQLQSMIVPWVRGDWIDVGERKWNPAQAKLTVLEGPELPPNQLTMGRGWRNAQRHGRVVTEQVLAAARDAQPVQPTAGATDIESQTDSLCLRILSDLSGESKPLHSAWELAVTQGRAGRPSESLALTERAVAQLLASGLLTLLRANTAGSADLSGVDNQAEQARILESLDSWIVQGSRAAIWIARS